MIIQLECPRIDRCPVYPAMSLRSIIDDQVQNDFIESFQVSVITQLHAEVSKSPSC